MTGTAIHKTKIFIVDDDEMISSMYGQYLQNIGYTDITLFQSGAECLDALSSAPEVVFLDHDMEGMTGLDVLSEIKRFDPDIYVVFISGKEDGDMVVSSLELGAFDFVTKGDGDIQRLSEVLQRIRRIKELLRRNKGGFPRNMNLLILL